VTISAIRTQEFTVSKIIHHAHVKAGLLNTQQSVNLIDAAFAEDELNALAAELAIEGIFPRDIQPYVVTLVANQDRYTVSDYAFDVVDMAMYYPPGVVAPNITETPVRPISKETYQLKPNKGVLGQPTEYYTDRLVEPVQVVVWPIPSTAEANGHIRFQIHALKAKNTGANTADFQRFWTDYLIHALAERLADNAGYTQQASRMGQLAMEKKQLCKAYSNERPNDQMICVHRGGWRGR